MQKQPNPNQPSMSKETGPQYPAKEGSKISGDPIIWAKAAGPNDCNATEALAIYMSTSGVNSQQATEVRLYERRSMSTVNINENTNSNGISANGDGNETFNNNTTASGSTKTLEQKQRSGYKNAVNYLKKLSQRDPSSLTAREKKLQKRHIQVVRKFENNINLHTPYNSTSTHIIQNTDSILMNKECTTPVFASTFTKFECEHTSSELQLQETESQEEQSTVKCGTDNAKTVNDVTIKRQRTEDGPQTSKNKRLKSSISLNSSPELQMAIIDRQHSQGKLAPKNWLLLEERIMRSLLHALNNADTDDIGKFDGAKWQNGIKVVGCGNKKALEFLTTCIRNQRELWPGAKLDVVPLKDVADITKSTTVRVWIPPPIMEDVNILSLIKLQNKDLKPDNWTIERTRERDNGEGKDLWIRIGPVSLQLLRPQEGRLKYGIGHIRMIIPSKAGSSKNGKFTATN